MTGARSRGRADRTGTPDPRAPWEIVRDARESFGYAKVALNQFSELTGAERRGALRTFLNESRSVALTLTRLKRQGKQARDLVQRVEGHSLAAGFAAVRDDLDHGSRLAVEDTLTETHVDELDASALARRFPQAVSFAIGHNGGSYWIDRVGTRHYFDDPGFSTFGGESLPDAPPLLSGMPLERAAHEYLQILDEWLVEAMLLFPRPRHQ